MFTFPYTPVPMSLCHLNGIINKSDKSALAKLLEKSVDNHGEPSTITVSMIDGIFLLHQLHQIPQKFGQISSQILHRITRTPANKIFLIFDEYCSPSIKDNEHILRDNFSRDFCIRGKINYILNT